MSGPSQTYGPVAFMKIKSSQFGRMELVVRYIGPDNHVVAMNKRNKIIFGLYVKDANNCRNSTFWVEEAVVKDLSECGPKFYGIYGINDISPYEHSWLYGEIDPETVVLSGTIPFDPLPSKPPTALDIVTPIESLEPKVQEKTLDLSFKPTALESQVTIGSIWTNGKKTWVIQDTAVETLGGRSKVRVWITDPAGKYGQAVYADGIAREYKRKK